MLHQPIDELLTDAEGKVIGVRAGDQVATAPHIIGDPSYFTEDKLIKGKKVNSQGAVSVPFFFFSRFESNTRKLLNSAHTVCFGRNLQVVRSICFLNHPVEQTKNNESCQLIIPALQVKEAGYPARSKDIYINVVSFAHCVAPKGKYIAIVSTEVETDEPLKARSPV